MYRLNPPGSGVAFVSSILNLRLLSCVMLGIFLMACSSDDDSSNAEQQSNSETTGAVVSLRCNTPTLTIRNAECGQLVAPQDYTNSTIDQRRIGYAVLPAIHTESSSVEPTDSPVVFLIGGPGPAATFNAHEFLEGEPLAVLRADRELILVDYRGVGTSEPALSCEFTGDVGSIADCAAAITDEGMARSELRSAVFARDIDLLLQALGHEGALLYGASYGTRVAMTMLRDVPDRIEGVILDGVFPPEVNGFSQGVTAPLAGLDRAVDRCNESTACTQIMGDLRSSIETLVMNWDGLDYQQEGVISLARLGFHPATPLLITTLRDLPAEESLELALSLADNEYFDGEVSSDSGETITEIPDSMDDRAESLPLTLSIICSEEAAFIDQQPLDASVFGFSSSVLGVLSDFTGGAPLSTEEAVVICEQFGADAAPIIETAPVLSDIPTLLLSGGADLQTSFVWGEIAAERLSNSTHVVIPLADHITVEYSVCAQSLVTEFLAAPGNALDLGCVDGLQTEILTESESVIDEY